MNDQRPLHELIPACDLSVFSNAERAVHHQHQQELFVAAKSTQELPDGYKLTWDANPVRLEKLRAWVKLEQRCCSFLSLEILEQADTISLTMNGAGLKGLLSASPAKILLITNTNQERN
jgi:hypothetical protein